MLHLIVAEQRADTLFLAALRSLVLSLGHSIETSVAAAGEVGFVPRLEDADSGRWIGVLEEQDGVVRASQALAMGASGIILPEMAPEEFEPTLVALSHSKSVYLPGTLARALAGAAVERPHLRGVARERLTPREVEVLALVAQGESNAEIARRLHVSVNTVRTHLHSLFMKLDVSGRTMLIREAWELGLCAPPPSPPRVRAEPTANGWRQRAVASLGRGRRDVVPKVGVEPTRA